MNSSNATADRWSEPVLENVDDQYWQELTKQANSAFDIRGMEAAKLAYRAALREALKLLERAERSGTDIKDAVPRYVVSVINTANYEKVAGNGESMVRVFAAGLERIIELLNDPQKSLAIKAACAHNLPYLIAETRSACADQAEIDLDFTPLFDRAKRASLNIVSGHATTH